jgi:hypothetical protein
MQGPIGPAGPAGPQGIDAAAPDPPQRLPPFIAKSYLLFAILWIACLAVSNVSHDEAYALKWVWGSTAPAILMLAVPYLSGTTTPERLSMTANQVALQISGYNFVWTHKQWGHAKIYTISVKQDGAIRVAESQVQESVSSSPPASGPSTLQSSLSTDTWIAVVRIISQLNAKKPLTQHAKKLLGPFLNLKIRDFWPTVTRPTPTMDEPASTTTTEGAGTEDLRGSRWRRF